MTKKKGLAAAAMVLAAILLNGYIVTTASLENNPLWEKLLLCGVVDLMALICIWQMEALLRIPLEIFRDRTMFTALVRNDFQARFAGAQLGIVWAYVQPVVTIVLYWFVFQFGLRSGNVSNHPFILYLMAGLIPWFYFSEAWNGATSSLVEYSYLVKKVVFNVAFLPALKIFSALFVHLFFTGILMALCLFYGYGLHVYLLQLPYYILCTAVLLMGLSYITAACTVFFRDTAQVVGIILTVGVWMTPIMWNPEITMSSGVHALFKLNPVYYIVDGYRDTLLDKVWFWEKPVWSIGFWCFSILVYLLGTKMFNRLRIHFSDVL